MTIGYRTGGFLTNPFAYYLADGMGDALDMQPEPVFQQGGMQTLWNLTSPLHQDSGIGSRLDEYFDLRKAWNYLGGMPYDLCMRYRPVASFEQAKRVLTACRMVFFCGCM